MFTFWSTRIGDWEVCELHDGRFALDGGAMFGAIPRVLWEKQIPPDSRHRIPLALRCLLLCGHDRLALVDTGIGDKWSPKELGLYDIRHGENDLARSLAHWGVRPEDVTDVLLTHLHFDHAGGNTRRDPVSGGILASFPEARYHVSRDNLAHARLPEERDHVSYLAENFEPLVEQGLLRTFEPGCEILPGVFAEQSDGHTPGLVTYRVQGASERQALVYAADLVPTAAHVRLNYGMGYDLCPRSLIPEKRTLMDRVVENGWILCFEHDPHMAAARVGRDERGRFQVTERFGGALPL